MDACIAGINRHEQQKEKLKVPCEFRYPGMREGDVSIHLKLLMQEAVCLWPLMPGWTAQTFVDLAVAWAWHNGIPKGRLHRRRIGFLFRSALAHILQHTKNPDRYRNLFPEDPAR